MKRTIKPLFVALILVFLITYMNRNNYYENSFVLSDDSIKEFENDLKKGKEIKPSNYIPKRKNYNNKYSTVFIKISKSIEIIVNKSLKKFINYLGN